MRTMRPPRSATPEPVDPESVSPSGPRRAAKQAALVLLCLLWIAVGLIGHDPWKNDDATTFGVAFGMARTGDVALGRKHITTDFVENRREGTGGRDLEQLERLVVLALFGEHAGKA